MSGEAEKIQSYRHRAKQLRKDAQELATIEAKVALLSLAANYEKIAAELEKWRELRT